MTIQENVRNKVPPGQIVTQGWPILNAGSVPRIQKKDWNLKVHGEVENPIILNYDDLLKLKRTRLVCDIHCVTTWSKLGIEWEGVKFKDLMEIAKPTSKANYAIFECEQGFTTNLASTALMDDDVLIAFMAQGKELESEHGGPVRMLVPKRYFYKSAKWLRGIMLAEEDEPGFWEIRGYSNSADPWNEERYSIINFAEIIKNRLKAFGKRK